MQGGGSLTDFVLDCSVAATWFFADEKAPETDILRQRAIDKGAVVPSLWHLEIGNVFWMAEKRGRMKTSDTVIHMDFIKLLPLEIDATPLTHSLPEILSLSRLHNLTVYDATYLELALRRGIALATRDKALRQAAEKLGLTVLPD
jgi:predicted nucleic acid-binding protein